jgi:hypothetical protein
VNLKVNDTFKYGDACESGDDKYVVAQFCSDASLAWVPDLRLFLNLPELKYRGFLSSASPGDLERRDVG